MIGRLRRADPGRSEGGRVPSPCTNVCRLDAATGWCEGCLRTMDEIAAWGGLDDAARREIWTRLPGRRQTLADFRDVGSSRVDLQACKLEYSIVSPK